jgi:hypothetical protein
MLALMLDPKLKSLRLISSFIGCELGIAIVIKYEKKLLFPMFLKFYHQLHPLHEIKNSFAITYDEEDGLDFF